MPSEQAPPRTLQLHVPDPSHPVFAGHFPGRPIVPGVLLLDLALLQLQQARALDPAQWQLASIKFLRPVEPGAALTLTYRLRAPGELEWRLQAAAGEVVSTALLTAGASA